MKKHLLLLLLPLAFSSCFDKTEKAELLKFEELKAEQNIYLSNDSTKPHMQMQLKFVYPTAFFNDSLLLKAQNICVEAFTGEKNEGLKPEEAFAKFNEKTIADLRDFATEMDDSADLFAECYQNITSEVADTSSNIVTLKTTLQNYMGGAHGATNITYYNMDTKTAELIKNTDLYSNYSEQILTKLITEALVAQYKQAIEEIVLDVEYVKPNNNFYLTKEGITYVYNEYEIAPYSSGLIEVNIPYAKLKELGDIKYSRN